MVGVLIQPPEMIVRFCEFYVKERSNSSYN
jgi:hypothetical protein